MLSDYIALVFDPRQPRRPWCTALQRALAADGAWRLAWDRHGLWVFVKARSVMPMRQVQRGDGVILGDLYDHQGRVAPKTLLQSSDLSPRQIAQALQSQFFGRYVAILQDGPGRPGGVFRDPSGAMDCLVGWAEEGTTVATSALPKALLAHLDKCPSVNWARLADQLADPGLINASSGVEGFERVSPGAFRSFLSRDAPQQIWRPTDFAKRPPETALLAGTELRDAVELSVGALAGSGQRILAEVSGGLDSAMVASALNAASATVVSWLHLQVDDPGADELIYARALAAGQDLNLTVRYKRRPTFAPSMIAEIQTGVAPSLNGFDPAYDQDVLEVSGAAAADSVFTGMAGDAVFFQSRTAVMIIDRVRRLGWAGLDRTEVEALARWDRRSGWSVLMAGVTGRLSGFSTEFSRSPRWIRCPSGATSHPWLHELKAEPPGKQMHVKGVVQLLIAYGASRRGRGLDIVHPLLSQPVLERAFATPADWLVCGGRDRGLVRQAFANRLSPLILERRSKADLSVFYARSLAEALPAIREYLLDGLLSHHAVVDRTCLEGALEEGYLAQHGGFFEILRAVALEGWARHWEARLSEH